MPQRKTERHITSLYITLHHYYSMLQCMAECLITQHCITLQTMHQTMLHRIVLNSIILHTGSYEIHFVLANDNVPPQPSEIMLPSLFNCSRTCPRNYDVPPQQSEVMLPSLFYCSRTCPRNYDVLQQQS